MNLENLKYLLEFGEENMNTRQIADAKREGYALIDIYYDKEMWERRYNTCFETRDKLHKKLDECVGMLNRVLLHVDLDYHNPSMKEAIKELLDNV